MKYYKVLGKDGVSCYGGSGQWHLPKNGKPGKWMPKIEDIDPCARGYHLCEASDLREWLNEEIYEAEGRGESVRDEDKTVFEQARLIRKIEAWNDRTARLFACECAERVLPIFEKHCPGDDRPRKAIEAARKFAEGEISLEKLDAAWDAAWAATSSATSSAARDAARDAERDWQTERLWWYLTAQAV